MSNCQPVASSESEQTMIDSFETLSFYRGVTGPMPVDKPTVRQVRTGRRPLHLPLSVHNDADAWFYEKFGVRYRSESIFVTGSKFVASSYAESPSHIVRIVPLGNYKFCWSAQRSDLYFYCSTGMKLSIEAYLEQSFYIEEELRKAHASGNEVMLFCETYVSIPVSLLEASAAASLPLSIFLAK
jgi:hypothetical protein